MKKNKENNVNSFSVSWYGTSPDVVFTCQEHRQKLKDEWRACLIPNRCSRAVLVFRLKFKGHQVLAGEQSKCEARGVNPGGMDIKSAGHFFVICIRRVRLLVLTQQLMAVVLVFYLFSVVFGLIMINVVLLFLVLGPTFRAALRSTSRPNAVVVVVNRFCILVVVTFTRRGRLRLKTVLRFSTSSRKQRIFGQYFLFSKF